MSIVIGSGSVEGSCVNWLGNGVEFYLSFHPCYMG
jgi:hypothetical protein